MCLSLYHNKRNRKYRITMKLYAYIFIITLCVLVHSGCRSNRSLSESSTRDIELTVYEKSTSNTATKETTNATLDKTTESNTQENAESISETSENKQVDEFEKTKEVKEEFDKNGNLKSRTTTETSRKRLERSDSRTGTHDASSRSESSVGNEQTQETKETDLNQQTEDKSELELDENEKNSLDDESNTDSRWIQGWEWLMVILPIAVICGIVYLIRNGRKKKHSK